VSPDPVGGSLDVVTDPSTGLRPGSVGDPKAQAEFLVEVLPYIRRFSGKIVVVKYGGNALAGAVPPDARDAVTPGTEPGTPSAMTPGTEPGTPNSSESALASFAQDVILLRSVGMLPVVVHGGGPQIGDLLRRVGKETQFLGGLRVTDADTLDIARMVLVGKVNRDIVSAMNIHGPLAVGLSGEDARMITAARRSAELGYVGDVVEIDPVMITRLLAEGLVPVVATIGADTAGQAYNINADTVAGAIAEALEAEKLVYLTDVAGLRSDPDDPATLLRRVTAGILDEMVASGAAGGGMAPKAEACARAVRAGVGRAHILDGRVPHALLLELFTDGGVGTMVVP
jgi:acetylglutamate kinase